MKDKKFENVLYVRRVFQMSVVTIISVLVVSIVIVFATGSTAVDSDCGPVENVIVTEESSHILLSWRAPTGADCISGESACILINKMDISDCQRSQSSSFEFEKESCTDYRITIWSLDVTATPASSYTFEHTSDIRGSGKVLNLRFENNLLVWDRPESSEGCNLEYEVAVDTKNLNPTKLTVSEQFVELTLIPCFENTISVTSIVTDNGRRGEEANIEKRGPVRSKAPIHESTNPKLTRAEVKWNKDKEENDCDFVGIKFDYFQIGTDDEMSVSFDINEFGSYELENLNLNTRYSYRASWILENTEDGENGEISDHIEFQTGSGKVLNLRFENNLLVWDRPESSEGCNLEYEVVVDTKNLNPTKLTVSEQSVELPLISCSENTISVTSIVTDNGRRGEEANIEKRGPVRSKPPIHESTDPDFTGAVVRWHKDEEENYCNFVEIKFYYSQIGTDDEMSVSFDINEYGSYELENLTPNTIYWYRAKWILKNAEDEENGEVSDYIEFQTTPLSDPHSIDFAIQTEGGIRITWAQNYEVHFITNHEIVVENLSPAHFLPKNCQTDKGEIIESVLLEPEIDYLVLSNVRPNFNYGITVTTMFGHLGLSTSYNTIITTPIDKPGFIEIIEINHRYANGVPHSVISNIQWNIPCDINGPVRHFDVKISGKLNAIGINGVCNIDFFTDIIPGQEQETFVIVTTDLKPFFHYDIHITTVLDSEDELSSETIKELEDVPSAYTPMG